MIETGDAVHRLPGKDLGIRCPKGQIAQEQHE